MKKLTLLMLSVALVFSIFSSVSAATYTVQKGDSLYLIAKKLNVRFYEILRLNSHLENPALIYPNQKINVPNVSSNPPTTQTPNNAENGANTGVSNYANEILTLVNNERSKQGLKPLTLSAKLTEVATEKAKDMAVNNYFSHTSPTYGSPFDMMKKFGVSYKSAGENIAAGQKTPAEVMQAWLNSSGHRANILNSSYTELGVGYYKGSKTYWVQQFIGN